MAFENIVGKGENAGHQYFSPFPTMVSNLSRTNLLTKATFNSSSADRFNLDPSKILSFCKKLYEANRHINGSMNFILSNN